MKQDTLARVIYEELDCQDDSYIIEAVVKAFDLSNKDTIKAMPEWYKRRAYLTDSLNTVLKIIKEMELEDQNRPRKVT